MPAAPPTAPPRKPKKITKQDISEPFDFVHCAHVGLDFNSEDVKNAIKSNMASSAHSSSQQGEFLYELVNQAETPILKVNSMKEEPNVPTEFAPEYGSARNVSTSSYQNSHPSSFNMVSPAPEVVDYVNRPSFHTYQNLEEKNLAPRPSRKKNPAPPPPPSQAVKPKTEEPSVAFRKISNTPVEAPQEEAPKINTPGRISAAPISVIIERPGLLGEMKLGLDDPIPLMTGIPSKYRSPTMLTPREMAVDVPTPMRSLETQIQKEEAVHRRPLVKESAIDIPSTPTSLQSPKTINPPEVTTTKKPAPTPPVESAETEKNYNPYISLSTARTLPQLKNVITELKTMQSKEETTEEEEHIYISMNEEKKKQKTKMEEKSLEMMKAEKSEPNDAIHQPTIESKEEKRAPPVPKPRRTVTHSVDISSTNNENKIHDEDAKKSPQPAAEPADDGIDTGYSDDDMEIIRL